jgi:aldose 1-epimerase
MKLALAILLTMPAIVVSASAQYRAVRDGDVVRLTDNKADTVVSILPSIGAVVFEMKIRGQNIVNFSPASLDAYRQRPTNTGIPFLGPWANRMDEQAFYFNGKKYAFNMDLGNVTGAHPIHGFLSYAPREVVAMNADANSAWLTTRLEVWRNPMWMAQFPFAHTVEVTQRLQNGELEVSTKIENLSTETMPLAIGFHPYFQLTDSPRDEWTLSVPAKTQYLLTPDNLPTGETRPIEQFFPNPQAVALKDFSLDHVFGDLSRDASGRAVMSVTGKQQKIEVVFGPKYPVVVLFSPKGGGRGSAPPAAGAPPTPPAPRNFICFEPMTGITDAINMAHKGLYKGLQTIAPGATWQESFWIKPSGF